MLPALSPATHCVVVEHDTAVVGPIRVAVQAEDPPAGLEEVTISPEPSTPTHKTVVVSVHDNPANELATAGAAVQAEEPPVGLVDANTSPSLSPKAQRLEFVPVLVQEMTMGSTISMRLSTFVTVHVDAPPDGLVEVKILPFSSTATHRSALGHDTLFKSSVASMAVTDHADAPPVGSVEVTTSPSPTATHSVAVGQEIPYRVLPPSTSLCAHAEDPAVGSVDVSTSPSSSTAAHNVEGVVVQDTPWNALDPSTPTQGHADVPPVGLVELNI